LSAVSGTTDTHPFRLETKPLLPLYLGALIGPMGGIGIVPLLPVLAQTWAIPFSSASLAITSYMIPFIIIQVFSGSLAQVFNVRKTLYLGFTLYALGGIFCGLSPGLWSLLGSRVIQGLGAGFLTPVLMAQIGELVPEKHLGKAIGFLGLFYTFGITFGPMISGLMEVHLGWPWFFYFLAALAGVTGLLYGWSSRGELPPSAAQDREGFWAVLPILRQALAQPGVLFLSASAFFLFIAFIGIMTFTAHHLRSSLFLSSDRIGLLLSSTGFSGILVSPIAGYLGDRLGRVRVFRGGTVIAFICVALMAWFPYTYLTYLLLFLAFGTGTAMAWTTLNTMAVQLSPSLRKPVTSVYNAVKFSGYALSPVVLALIYGPFQLRGVQLGCLAAILISSLLTLKSRPSLS